MLTVAATFTIVGCQKETQPVPKRSYDFKIERLRDVGQPIPNPKITLGDCIPEGSKETLESVRYVPGKSIYYMDYTAKVDWENLLAQPEDEHFPVFCMEQVSNKISKALFKSPVLNKPIEGPYGSCSGFICNNKNGELLNCRNFDGDVGEMVVIFNHNVKQGEHKSVMMADLSWAQMYAGDLNYLGDEVLLKGKEMNVRLRQLNMHWCISDASGKWRTLEYWKDEKPQAAENPKGKTDILYVYDEEDRPAIESEILTKSYTFGAPDKCGAVSRKLYNFIRDIQEGREEDIHNWCLTFR